MWQINKNRGERLCECFFMQCLPKSYIFVDLSNNFYKACHILCAPPGTLYSVSMQGQVKDRTFAIESTLVWTSSLRIPEYS